MYNPGAFQTAAPVLGLRLSDLVLWPYEWRLCFLLPSGSLRVMVVLLIFKGRFYGDLSSLCRSPQPEVPDVEPDLFVP